MTRSSENDHKIEKVFAAAWDKPSDFRESRTWQADTMRQIRHIGPLNSNLGYFLQFGQNIWRLVPVACILIIALTVMVIQSDFIPQDAVLTVFDYTMEELTLIQVVGL